MAKDSGIGTALTLGAVGIGGYFLYEWLTTPATTTAATPSTACQGAGIITSLGGAAPTVANVTALLAAQGMTPASYYASIQGNPSGFAADIACILALFPNLASSTATPVSTTVTTDGAPVTPPAPTTVEPPPQQPAPSLAAIYSNILAGASTDPNFTGAGDSLTASGYRWNVYLGLALPSADAIPQPAGFDLSQNMTATQYWAVMGPALTQAYGLAGFMAGLGAYRASMRGLGDDTVTDDLTGIVYDMSGNIVSQPGVPYTSGGVTITPTAPGSVTTANCPGPGCPTGSAASSLGGISSTTWLMIGAGGLLLLAAFGSKR